MATWKHLVIVSSMATALVGCNREARNAENQESQPQPAGQEASAGRKDTVAVLRRELDTLSARIETMEKSLGKTGAKARKSLEAELQSLESARDRVAGKLEALQITGVEKWDELKASASKSLDSLSQAVNQRWKSVSGEGRAATAEKKGRQADAAEKERAAAAEQQDR